MSTGTQKGSDQQLDAYLEAIRQLQEGQYDLEITGNRTASEFSSLESALTDLARALETERRQRRLVNRLTTRINAGLLLDDILEYIYEDFRELIPYNRIGLALIDDDGQTVRSRWNRSDSFSIYLRRNYSAPLAGSSLETILRTSEPRILNDLEAYLREKPTSESTRLLVEEGVRSSLTCPLIANGAPLGFLFFSSTQPHIYAEVHVELYQQIAGQLSVIVEKGRLVSELAEQKRAIERQNRELRHLNDLKNTFLGIAAHDLRNPLGLIEMGMLFLLDPKMAATEQEQQTVLRDVYNQSRHMLNLIDELLDVTEIEAGKLNINRIMMSIAPFLEETVSQHNQLASPKGTRIVLASNGGPGDRVRADPLRLRQVLDNLISNGVKFSPAGSVVRVRARPTVGAWLFSVEDQGPGVLPEERQHLFQDFARLSARPTGGERSTGLGLAIARRVVEAHGGQIGVESTPGQGATFWFTLPGDPSIDQGDR